MAELSTSYIKDSKFYLGEKEFTNILWTMIRSYRWYNKGQDPVAIVIPRIKDIEGIEIEYQADTETKSGSNKTGG